MANYNVMTIYINKNRSTIIILLNNTLSYKYNQNESIARRLASRITCRIDRSDCNVIMLVSNDE